jgi:putative hydrolase of the HAD superfamily
MSNITTLFLDIGGVILTNGWDHNARSRACARFQLDPGELEERHHLTYDTYEEGKLSLDEYLGRTVFYKPRQFTLQDFKTFMFAQSKPFSETLELFKKMKGDNHLKVLAVSNEGRELTKFRIQKFQLGSLFDVFISSCFVHYRKPDKDIYTIALDIAQASPQEVVYIDDRAMFVEIAETMGIHGIHHINLKTTKTSLDNLGL